MEYEEQMRLNYEIAKRKSKLANKDYQAIKYAEGELTEEEYAPIREQRRQWRAEINELQGEPVNEPQQNTQPKVTSQMIIT